ncbi:MAG: 4Fe-4S dicluster domain-containing protein [Persicimonas sp.]
MTFVITEPCLGTCDTSCVEVCPVDCIHGPMPVDEIMSIKMDGDVAKLADIQLFIDPDICIDCGACEPECPVEAIFEEWDVPDEWEEYIDLNAAFFEA